MHRTSLIKFFVFAIILLAIPLLTILSQQAQEIRQRASGPEEKKSQEEQHESESAKKHENDDKTKPNYNQAEKHEEKNDKPQPPRKPTEQKLIVYQNQNTTNTYVTNTTNQYNLIPSLTPTVFKNSPLYKAPSINMTSPTASQCAFIKVPVTNIKTSCNNCTLN